MFLLLLALVIAGRSGEPIYRAKLPSQWEQIPTTATADTMLPIAEYRIGEIEIVVHSFPAERFESRIPPAAQTARWRRQLTDIEPGSESLRPYAHGGFAGERYEAVGNFRGKRVKVLAYALTLDPSHFRALSQPEKRGDYTIKAMGPPEEFLKYQREIEQFARSFELLEEIPCS